MIFFLACVTLSTWILALLTYIHVAAIRDILESVRTHAKSGSRRGGAVVSDDSQCTVCGRPRSVGCEDPEYCEWQTFVELGSCDPAAMAELMREDES